MSLPDLRGRPAVLVGNGPSMRGFAWERLTRVAWLGINRAAAFSPTIAFVSDTQMRDWIRGAPGWHASPCRVHHRHVEQESLRDVDPGIVELPRCREWSTDLARGLVQGNSSGLPALNLLDLLGTDPIYLLGFDLRAAGGSDYPAWYLDAPVPEGGHALRHALEDFRVHAAPRARVFNATLGSAITRWPYASLDDVLLQPSRTP